MEWENHLESSEERKPVEIDIRKILVQMGLTRDRWPQEWRDSAEENLRP